MHKNINQAEDIVSKKNMKQLFFYVIQAMNWASSNKGQFGFHQVCINL